MGDLYAETLDADAHKQASDMMQLASKTRFTALLFAAFETHGKGNDKIKLKRVVNNLLKSASDKLITENVFHPALLEKIEAARRLQ